MEEYYKNAIFNCGETSLGKGEVLVTCSSNTGFHRVLVIEDLNADLFIKVNIICFYHQ